MVHVLVIGASGFIGQKLAHRLVELGRIGPGDDQTINELTLADVTEPQILQTNSIAVRPLKVDITDPFSIQHMLRDGKSLPRIIFHLAAIVSGEAERNFDLGYRVNVDGMRLLLEAIRHIDNYIPRLVFSSSLAVFGPPFPEIIPDDWATTPRGCYGTQKALAELLLEDYTRRCFVDGVSIRFPTIAIRPGQPNQAASSFVSGIIREPLHGKQAKLPVSLDFRHTVASPRAAVGYLLHAATLHFEKHHFRTPIMMPGISLTVREMLEALERVAGTETRNLVQVEPDPFIMDIVDVWPRDFACKHAYELGFQADTSYDSIIRAFIEDEGIEIDRLKSTNQESLGLQGFSHISINVPDIDKAIEFYHRVLGFGKMQGGNQWGDFDFRGPENEAFAKNAGFMDGKCKVDCVWLFHPQLQLNLELMRFDVPNVVDMTENIPKTQDVGGIKHLSYVVKDINAAFHYLKQQPDIRFVTDNPSYQPLALEPFPFKFMYFIDPFGVQWELEEYGSHVVTNNVPSVTRQMDAFIEFK